MKILATPEAKFKTNAFKICYGARSGFRDKVF